jgi:hypothetical protein
MEFQAADIVITTDSKSWFSAIILSVLNFFQKDDVKYQHAMLVVDEAICIEANWEVEYSNIETRLVDFKRYKVLRHKELTEEQRAGIVEKATDLLGLRYSVARILLQLCDQLFNTNYFSKRIKDPEQQICSSLIAWCYGIETGIEFNKLSWAAVEPDDIDDESLRDDTKFETILEWEIYKWPEV